MPVFEKFCFCAPLRPGLLVCRYIKLVCLLILIAVTIWLMVDEYDYIWGFFAGILAILLIDTAFNIVFIVGAHNKNYKYLRICYIYGIVSATLITAGLIFGGGYMIFAIQVLAGWPSVLVYAVPIVLALIINTPLQIYILLLTKSEILKLKDNAKMKYVKNSDGDALYERQEDDGHAENI